MDMLLVIGGEGKDCFLNDIWSSNDGITWLQEERQRETENGGKIPLWWCPRKGHAIAVLNDKLYIIGGVTTSSMIKDCDEFLGDEEEAAAASQVWSSATTTSSPPSQLLPPHNDLGCSSTSLLNLMYLCDCFVTSSTSEYYSEFWKYNEGCSIMCNSNQTKPIQALVCNTKQCRLEIY